jgi:AraC family transcriptional regulator
MFVQPQVRQDHQSDAVLRVIELLHDAAALVLENPDATQTRLSEASNLLNALHAAPRSNGMIRVLAPWQAERIHSFIDAHLDQTIRIDSLAGQVQLSVSHFFRAFRGTFGMTPQAFIMQCRAGRAKEMLICTNEPISHIASACGFADQAHLSRIFVRHTGTPPAAWRRLQRSKSSDMAARTSPSTIYAMPNLRTRGKTRTATVCLHQKSP